jgi:glycosyltransferase involved in cell wall biosynthesis
VSQRLIADKATKVSVVIPAYNNALYTVETVKSVLAQTYRDFEVIVVDDGSTDHTREVLEPFGNDITYIHKENGGACSARNLGIRYSDSEFVACLDCDDVWLPEHLERSVGLLEERTDLGFVFGPCYLIDGGGAVIGMTNYKFNLVWASRDLIRENYVGAPTVVIRRSCLKQVGLFDEQIFIPADWDLWLRLANEFPIGYIDEPLAKYRMVSNYTLRNIGQYIEETQYVLAKHLDSFGLDEQNRGRVTSGHYLNYAALYRDQGDMTRARAMIMRAIRANPRLWAGYRHLGLSYLGLTFWRLADRIKDRLWGGWMLKMRNDSL